MIWIENHAIRLALMAFACLLGGCIIGIIGSTINPGKNEPKNKFRSIVGQTIIGFAVAMCCGGLVSFIGLVFSILFKALRAM